MSAQTGEPNTFCVFCSYDPKVYGYQHTGDGIHSNIYMKNVRNRLVQASDGLPFSTAQEKLLGAIRIRDELQKIAMELANGTFPTLDPG